MAETQRVRGTTIPKNPLELRRLVTSSGKAPVGTGTGGWVHWHDSKKGQAKVSSASHAARFWPAKYDKSRDVWIVQGPGEQWKDGRIIQRFPYTFDLDKRGRIRGKMGKG